MATNEKNLIQKFTFAFFGDASAENTEKLKKFLLQMRRKFEHEGQTPPAPPTIYKWFRGSNPSRTSAFRFLLDVIEHPSLGTENFFTTADQRKIRDQIKRFLRAKAKSERSNFIRMRSDGTFLLKTDNLFRHAESKEEMDYYTGNYISYRKRMGSDKDQISIEYLDIRKVEGCLYADWWFLTDGKNISKFEGSVFFIGRSIWLCLYNPRIDGRLRFACFERFGWGRERGKVYSGFFMSTKPSGVGAIPSGARVLVQRANASLVEGSLSKTLRHVDIDKFEHENDFAIKDLLGADVAVPGRLDGLPHLP